jgi:protein-ribulosamine 3-kinase
LTPWQRAAQAAAGAAAPARWTPCAGSPWGRSWSLAAGGARWFVKTATGDHRAMAGAEAEGLRALGATHTIRVPQVVACDEADGTAFVILEWLDMGGARDDAALGRALAALHCAPAPRGPAGERYGWARDNWIGGTPQRNGWRDAWPAFFRDARLAPQIALAARNGHDDLARDAERLLAVVPALLAGHDPAPSLLHGDLWSGNAGLLHDGTPVVFDPAVYVGDREADLAMTELFGGFGGDFRAAYGDAWPAGDGYALRRELYNLYHILNHVNLFGGSYPGRARRMMSTLLAAAG